MKKTGAGGIIKKKTDEEFWVYTMGKESSLEDCYDNYQHEEIDTAIEEQLESLCRWGGKIRLESGKTGYQSSGTMWLWEGRA